jgi:hypothetical protein
MSQIQVNPHRQVLKPLEMEASKQSYVKPGESVNRSEIKVKFRDSEKIAAYQQKAENSRNQELRLGSKIQMTHIKALVEEIPVHNVQVQASKLGKLDVIKKYANLAGSTLLKGITSVPGTVWNKIKGFATSLPIVSHVIEYRQVKALRMEASLQQRKADGLKDLAKKIGAHTLSRASLDPDPLNNPEITRGSELYAQLNSQAETAERIATALNREADGKTLKEKVKSKLQTLRTAVGYGSMLLSPTGSILKQSATQIIKDNHLSSLWLNQELTTNHLVKHLAVDNQALKTVGNLGVSAQAIGIVGGAITIGTESYDLAQTAASLKSSLNQRKYALRVLMTPEQRAAKIQSYEAAALKAEKAGKIFGPNLGKASALRAKAKELMAINALDKAGHLNRMDQAIAEQVARRTDWKFKAAKMLKHSVAIAGGVLAVVSASLAIAGVVALLGSNPVGWAALAVGLTATIAIGGGLGIYAGVKTWRREKKIDMAESTHKQIEFKTSAIGEDQNKLKSQKTDLQDFIQAEQEKQNFFKRILNQNEIPSRAEIAKFKLEDYFDEQNKLSNRPHLNVLLSNSEMAVIKARQETEYLEKEIQHKEDQLKNLKDLSAANLVQLMASSPKRAGEHIMKGYKAGDPTMTFMAERVLKVPPHTKDLPDILARKYFMTIPLGPQ